jgi:hypothetical protein
MAAMTEARKLIEFLQNTVPAGTPVTISSEINILESLGVVSDERAVSAMRTASLFIAPDSPATFRGLMNLLTQLIRMNPKFADKHKGTLDKALAEAGQIDDFTLNFGTFLPICQKLLDAKESGEPALHP